MSKPPRIPRPRHLFPELAAFLIEWKRTNLRAARNFRRAIGHVPIWVTGSVAGLLGVMLAISLFFVHEPELHAAATPVEIPQPRIEPVPTIAVPQVQGRPDLMARLQLTDFPFVFDENLISVTSSTAPKPGLGSLSQINDLWRRAQSRDGVLPAFASYLIRAAGNPSTWPRLLASEFPDTRSYPGARGLGIQVLKTTDLHGSAHEPVTYEIVVRNRSGSAIENLSIREKISSLVRVTDVVPEAGIAGDELVWNVDLLPPDGSRTFLITVTPESEGEIATTTSVVPTSRVSAVVDVHPRVEQLPPKEQPKPAAPGAPELKLTYTEVKPLKQGEILSMIFEVKNVGTAVAEDVQLFVRLSGQFEHRYGEFVKHQVGALQPGQSRRALLQATARDPGEAHLDASLTMQGAEKEARELKIPIHGGPVVPGRLQPVVNRPVTDHSTQLTALESN
ncbi:hypothetical protein SH661x_000512 [Planctomicrobium sp. SH661]|uniref:hypothetical protein n=1 Tax=Planctomicrobium sp. SH661 TaxID=3448124 RepID=UPI003F5B45E4